MRINMMIITILLFTIGCTNDQQAQFNKELEKSNTEPISYETPNERNKGQNGEEESIGEQGGYPHNYRLYNKGPENGPYTDIFTNDESMQIENHLNEMDGIKQAQVASSNDKIVVGVLLTDRPFADKNITNRIEEEVRKMVPNKTVVVYTDDIHWDRMKNLQAKLKQSKVDSNFEQMIEDFFNWDDD